MQTSFIYDCTPRFVYSSHPYTGKERDSETGFANGNDYFGARYYASSMGRWMSPDWSAKEEPVPYAQLDDPQSLNLYSYVSNNPLWRPDGDGHAPTTFVWTKRNSSANQAAENKMLVGAGIGAVALAAAPELGIGAALRAGWVAASSFCIFHCAEILPHIADAIAPPGAPSIKFASPDKLVGDLANEIEAAHPGSVVGVNVPILRPDGSTVTDADILLKNAIIQVKSGGGKGLSDQVMRTESATGLLRGSPHQQRQWKCALGRQPG